MFALPRFLRRAAPATRGLLTLTKADIMPTAIDIITALKANVDALKAQHAAVKSENDGLRKDKSDLELSVSDLTTREANITRQLSDLSDGVDSYVTTLGLQPHGQAAAPVEHPDAAPPLPAVVPVEPLAMLRTAPAWEMVQPGVVEGQPVPPSPLAQIVGGVAVPPGIAGVG